MSENFVVRFGVGICVSYFCCVIKILIYGSFKIINELFYSFCGLGNRCSLAGFLFRVF